MFLFLHYHEIVLQMLCSMFSLLSNLQFTELLLFLDEFRDIWEWLWLCECDGLESVDRTDDGWSGPANGLGVTVTIGCTEPEMCYYVEEQQNGRIWWHITCKITVFSTPKSQDHSKYYGDTDRDEPFSSNETWTMVNLCLTYITIQMGKVNDLYSHWMPCEICITWGRKLHDFNLVWS